MIIHIDMDAFFASVEQMDNPELRGKPVIVGGSSDRGVVSTCSYEARAFGVHSAMPMVVARRLCPQAIIVRGRYPRYSELSHAIMDALLGAAGLRDIGTYFPDTDQAFKDISSLVLLEKVRHLLREKCCRIVNLDVTLLAQRPKIKPYVPQMIANIAEALRIPKTAVSVKATTTEKLGFVGREEGMAAQAAAMVLSYQ